jgi:hypothetical protein
MGEGKMGGGSGRVARGGEEEGSGWAACGGEEGGSDQQALSSEVWRSAPVHIRRGRVAVGEAGAHGGGSGMGSLTRGPAQKGEWKMGSD